MPKTLSIDEIIENIETFPPEDQDMIFDIIKRRRVEKRREDISNNIIETRVHYQNDNVKRGTVKDLLK